MSNVKACCGSCNYIKKNMGLGELFDKMLMIYNKHLPNIQKEKNQIKTQKYRNNKIESIGIDEYRKREREQKQKQRNQPNITKNTTKKTTDEKREEARIRKQKQREKLKEKYGDEEYKQKRAKELAEYRKFKKETNF